MQDLQPCPACSGSGIRECPDCGGAGKDNEGRACLPCRGKAVAHCPSCDGRGQSAHSGPADTSTTNGRPPTPASSSTEDREREERRRQSMDEYNARQERKRRDSRNLAIRIVLVVVVLAGIPLFKHYYPDIKSWFGKSETESTASWLTTPKSSKRAIDAASELLEKNLTSPSSAKYVSRKVVAQSPPYYLVHLVVDSDNEFGTKVRSSVLVSIELVDSSRYKYNPLTSVQEANDPPLAIEIELLKQLNRWPGTGSGTDGVGQQSAQSQPSATPSPEPPTSVPSSSASDEILSTEHVYTMNELYADNSEVSTDVILSPKGLSLVGGDWTFEDPDLSVPLRFGDLDAELIVGREHPNTTKFLVHVPDRSVKYRIDGYLLDAAFNEYGDLNEGYRVNASIYDFDRDGNDEIVLAVSDSITTGVAVYSYREVDDPKKQNPMKQVLSAEGQSKVILDGEMLITPIGSNDGWTYTYRDGQFNKG